MSRHVSRCVSRRAAGVLFGTMLASVGASAAPPDFHQVVGLSAPNLWYKFDEPANATAIVNHGSWGSAYNATPFNGVLLNQASSLHLLGREHNGNERLALDPREQPGPLLHRFLQLGIANGLPHGGHGVVPHRVGA